MAESASTDARTNFDLLNEPWLVVRLLDGSTTEVSLLEAFRRADSIRELAGELSTQDFAVLRLMLAILYRAVQWSRITGANWQRWWEQGLPVDEIEQYLSAYRDRFDLLHRERPFYQVAELRTAKDEPRDVTPLIFDLPTRNRLFTTRAGAGASHLSFAEAARWLIHTQAFDTSGIKSGALGDPRVIGGKGYPIGVAWLGLLGGVLAEGDNLRETLLLNLVGPSNYLDCDEEQDLPPWERDDPDTAADRGDPPHGPVGLFTWQSRRIRLMHDGASITSCLVTNGDQITPQNLQHYEPATAWRFSELQTRKLGRTTYMPREHQPGRAFWRGISALLPRRAAAGGKAAPSLAPGVLEWLSFLQENGRLAANRTIRLRAVGVVYGSNNSVVDEIIDDRLLIPLAVLRADNPDFADVAERAVDLAEDGVRALRHLAQNLARAAGGEPEGPGQYAESLGYASLDAPYRQWLAALGSETAAAALDRWRIIARNAIADLGDDLIAASGPSAWAGRLLALRPGAQPELLTSSRAENWFRSALRKTFGTQDGKESAA